MSSPLLTHKIKIPKPVARRPTGSPLPSNPFLERSSACPTDGPGTDVYGGVALDYTGASVTAENFLGVLLANGTNGGYGHFLDTLPTDDVFIFYVVHGVPGILEFLDGEALHAPEFQQVSSMTTLRWISQILFLERPSTPNTNGLGTDVYCGVALDYPGANVAAENFLGVLLGKGMNKGNERFLDILPTDDVFISPLLVALLHKDNVRMP